MSLNAGWAAFFKSEDKARNVIEIIKTKEIDIACVSYHCLSLAVRYFFPDNGLTISEKRYKQIIGLYPENFSLIGSYAENLDLPILMHRTNNQWRIVSSSSLDVMQTCALLQEISYTIEHVQESKNIGPGYCFLNAAEAKPEYEQYLLRRKGKEYIRNSILQGMFCQQVTPETIEMVESLELSPDSSYHSSSEEFVSNAINRPVLCVAAPWPKDATDWVSRNRTCEWPSENVINQVEAAGCHLVSSSNARSKHADIEWQYSFSIAEVSLAQTLSKFQKISYRVFKALIQYHLKTRDLTIPSYYLKTTLFWMCEKSDVTRLRLDTTGWMLLRLLDNLLCFLKCHHLPMYFIPEKNLIQHIPYDTMKSLISGIEFIRENPLQCIEEFHHSHNTFPFHRVASSNLAYGCSILQMVSSNQSVIIPAKVMYARISLELFGVYYALNSSHLTALNVAKTICTISDTDGRITLGERICQNMKEELKLLKEVYLKYLVHMISDTPYSKLLTYLPACENKMLSAKLRAEVACICFQLSNHTDKGKPVKDILLEESRQHFESAVLCESCPHAVFVRYAEYLVVRQNYPEAFSVLRRIVKENNLSQLVKADLVCHSRHTDKSVEETLRILHMVVEDELRFRVYPLAYYLLHICCRELGIDPNESGASELEVLCEGEDLIFFEACISLKYEGFLQALHTFMKRRLDLKHYHYMWFCVAKLVCALKN